jgi:hypothetical protein
MNTSSFLKTTLSTLTQGRTTSTPGKIDREMVLPNRRVTSGLTVEQILERYTHIPAQTIILGICEDGLPVLFDLMDDHPGPLLITGDAGCGKTMLMQNMVKIAVSLNSPFEVKYATITSNPEEWSGFLGNDSRSHCFASHADYDENAGNTIMRLAEIAEQRRCGREEGPAILLMIDDLRFIAKADFDVRLNFEWLLKSGPSLQIWPVVSLPTAAAMEMSRVVSYFRTRIIGKMPAGTRTKLTLYDGLSTENLQTGKQFAVRVQDDWLKFWLPVRS